MRAIADKEERVLHYLQERLADGLAPSVREICEATGIKSTSTVHACLRKLQEEGAINRQGRLNRAIRLPGEGTTVRVPLLGRVTAGKPILAVEEVEGYVPYTGGGYSQKELFALRVSGTSMINAGILDRDVVIVRRTDTAENGDIVVALIDDEATVKRFYRENGHFRLQPENDAFEPIIVDDVTVLGKVVSLVRYF